MTTLRGINFGPCWQAAGVQGWGGEGYWFHHLPLISLFYDFHGSTRVTKTATMWKNGGNMPLKGERDQFAPEEAFPACIWWDWLSGRTLNAVGLSGPGAHALARLLFWPTRRDVPFMISFMAVRPTLKERLQEFASFVALFLAELRGTENLKRIGLQINISCPNTGLDTNHLVEEANKMLDISAQLPVPKILKINILPPVSTIAVIAQHPECDALCFTNALPFGFVLEIPWDTLFPYGSPLEHRNKKFGGGGYSGPELLPLVAAYSRKLRSLGVEKPFNVGGGIRSPRDVDYLVDHGKLKAGRDSIFFASVAMVRPWNIQPIIRRAHKLLG